MAETKAVSCPNCGKPAIRTGDEIACEHCDAEFVITKKGGAKLKDFGRFEEFDKRLKTLEEKADTGKPKQTESEEEEDI